MKRVPFVDHVIVLDKHGYITEQGPFSALDAAGGYVSGFHLDRSELDVKTGLKSIPEASDVRVYTIDKEASDTDTESHRGAGDMSVYLYYVRSIGWPPTIFFAVAITGFIFCLSFPSKQIFSTISC